MNRTPRLLIATLLVAVTATVLGAPFALDHYGAWRRARQHEAGMAVMQRSMDVLDQTAFNAQGEATNFVVGGTLAFDYQRSGPAFRMEYRSGEQSLGGVATDGRLLWRTRPDGWVGDSVELLDNWSRIDLPRVERKYWVLLTGRRRIGGRPSYEVTIVPRGFDRRERQFFVDAERYIILGAAQYDLGSGRPVAETHFTTVSFAPPHAFAKIPMPVAAPTPVVDNQPVLASATLASAMGGASVVAPQVLPGGFVLHGATVCECPDHCGIHLVHLRYSNGKRSMSLFERVDAPHRCVDPSICCAHAPEGRVISGGGVRFLTLRRHGLEFTLVGNLSEPALREIGGSLE